MLLHCHSSFSAMFEELYVTNNKTSIFAYGNCISNLYRCVGLYISVTLPGTVFCFATIVLSLVVIVGKGSSIKIKKIIIYHRFR